MRKLTHQPDRIFNAASLDKALESVDFQDPRYQTACGIHGTLRGSNCLNPGKSTLEVIGIIMKKLPAPQVVQTWSDEVLEIKKAEMEHKRAFLDQLKASQQLKHEKHLAAQLDTQNFERRFMDAAKRTLAAEDYQALVDLAHQSK